MVSIGHWTADDAATGCTVVLFDPAAVVSGEIRGGAPATREFGLLDPRRTVQRADAVVLSGGSAFGLATADGVMSWLAEAGRGFPTRAGRVPIVVAMGLFDLSDGVAPPGAAQGRLAAESASEDWSVGKVGAGAGATMAKWRGPDHARPAGLGYDVVQVDALEVHALVAVNAVGEIDDGTITASLGAGTFEPPEAEFVSFENTTIGVVWTNAALDKVACRLVAESSHDGLGRALMPAHTSGDGDALVVASVGSVEAELTIVRMAATTAVERAVRSVADRDS